MQTKTPCVIFLVAIVLAYCTISWTAPVTFNDTALLNAVKTQWEAATGGTLSDPPQDTELSNPLFTTLVAKELEITDLTGLEACTSLTDLNLGMNHISDLTPLSGLIQLVNLDLGLGGKLGEGGLSNPFQTGANLITDITPLAGLVNLDYLSLMGNDLLTSIAPVSAMDSLSVLLLASNPLTDFSPLSGVADTLVMLVLIKTGVHSADITIINEMIHLQTLAFLAESNLTDISGLTAIRPSAMFAVMLAPVSDMSVVENFATLQQLITAGTHITSIPNLSGLTSLHEAVFNDSFITDISGLVNAGSIQVLSLNNNAISDIGALSSCTGLHTVSLYNNQIEDIQPLLDNPNVANFQQIDIQDNAFAAGTPFCDENQLDQFMAAAPSASIVSNAYCGLAYNLSITVNGTGTTSPKPGITPIEQYTQIGIYAYAVSGSGQAFSHWSGDVNSMNESVSVFMDGDKSITANFVPGDWDFTLNKTGDSQGFIFPSPGVYSYLDGRYAHASLSNSSKAYFNGWSGDATGYAPNISVLMDAHKTVSASFTSTGYQLTFHTQGSGYIDGFWGSEPYYYASGASFTLRAQPGMVHRFDHWEGDLPAGTDPYSASLPVVMDQDRDITAVFLLDAKTLTIVIDGAGSTNPEGSASPGTQYVFATGQTTCVNALVSAGVAFSHWEGDIGGANPNNLNICITMDQDRTLNAHFVEADWNLTLQASGNGTTNPVPGVYGYVNDAQPYISMQLLPGGNAFTGWTGDIGNNPSAANGFSVTMDRHRTITANFAPGNWTLTLDKADSGGANGSLSMSPGVYSYLDKQTAHIAANTNSSAFFAGWTGDVTETNPALSMTMDGNKSVTANFDSTGYSLTVSVDGQGWTNLNGTTYWASGMKPVLIASPQNGWFFSYWSGDLPDGSDPNNPELPVLMGRNRTLVAHFIQDMRTLTIIIEGEGVTNPSGSQAPGTVHNYAKNDYVFVGAELGMGDWAFSHWSGDTGGGDPAKWFLELTMDRNRTITAHFVPAAWHLTVNYTGNGSIYPLSGTYAFGQGAIFEVVANVLPGGDAFYQWSGDVPAGVDAHQFDLHLTMDQDRTLTAEFAPGDFTLIMNPIEGGGTAEIFPSPGIYSYFAGQTAWIEARMNTGMYWGGWTGDINTFDKIYRFVMDDNKEVTPHVTTTGFTLTLNTAGAEGSITPAGTTKYSAGATPMIHAHETGSGLFENWTGDLPAGMDPTDRDPVVLMDQNRTLTANFVEADFYLYLQVIGNGTTDPAPELYWHRNGDAFTVTATPGGDFLFLQWQGNVPAGQDPASRTISGTIDQNVELIAVFVPESVTVPDLSGKTQAEAEAMLAVLGLLLGEVTLEYSDTVSLGHVITQNPVAATSVVYGSTVSIVVSRGPCIAPVPNLIGLPQAEAETALAAANLILGTIAQENSDTVPEGHIISQDPVFGLSVACNSPVALVLSMGASVEGEEGEIEGQEDQWQTADQDRNNQISLSELLRVIQFFNSGGYHCESGTEDGFAPGLGDTNCTPHASDYNTQDWLINLSELLRLIQFFNSGGYHYCPEDNTEDGFCPGPA